MKKKQYSIIFIILIMILVSVPVIMVYFFRMEFENYEIRDIDVHLNVVQKQVNETYEEYAEDEDGFLKAIKYYMARHSEFGALIILNEEYDMIFPEDESGKEARYDLADEFADAIQRGMLQNESYFDTEDGLSLRISFSSLQREDSDILYSVAYYDTDQSSSRIDQLESVYLQISAFSFLVLLVIIILLYLNYFRNMQLLSDEILRIGTQNYAPSAIPPSVGSMEKVRKALESTRKQLKLTSDRRETVNRSVNHYIRNHLMVVNGYAQGIETGVFSAEDASLKIRMENKLIEELLHNISIQSYIREQTIPENDEVLCLADEVETSFSKYEYIADRKNITLSLLPGSREITARGTSALMETVLDNLVSNAVRYASSKVTVSIEEEADKVVVRVKDDGPGIREKDLVNVFQPMFKGKKGNIGIGLSVAQDAAKYMGGSLRAENSPEGGAAFILSLPVI